VKSFNPKVVSIAVLLFLLPNLNFAQIENYNFQQESSSLIQAILDSVSIDSIYQTERHLTGEEPFWIDGQLDSIKSRYSYYNIGITAAQNYLQHRFEKMGYTVELQPFLNSLNNIIVTKTGTIYPDQYYILGAHYDSTSPLKSISAPGADDNGSGTAVVVEAARVLAKTNFQSSVKFILFSGEEQGKNGSEYYAGQAYQHDENIEGMINLDMIGYDGNDDGVFEIHTGYMLDSQNIGNVVSAIVTDFNLSLVPEIYSGSQSTSRSDHYSFWFWDYPAVLLIEDFFDSSDSYPFYHTTDDLLSKLNPDFFLDMARVSIGTLASLAGIDSITSDIPLTQIVPNEFVLYAPYPNPFNPSVNIEYQVSAFENISIKIYDSLGRIITILLDESQNPGNYSLIWNGVNTSGDLASSGIYFVTFQAGGIFEKQKIILMR
jgi:hypothetical protein